MWEKCLFVALAVVYACYLLRLFVREEFLLFLRQAMLGMPGIAAYGVVLMYDESAFFAFHMQVTQTLPITRQAIAMTVVALISSHLGFQWIKRRTLARASSPDFQLFDARLQIQIARILTYPVVLSAAFYLASVTVPVWQMPYGLNILSEPVLRNLNALLSIGFSVLFGALIVAQRMGERSFFQKLFFILTFSYAAVWCLWLRGSRMDVYNVLIALGLTFLAFRRLQAIRRVVKLQLVSFAAILLLLGQLWGSLRNRDYFDLSQLSLAESLQSAGASNDIPINLSTLGDVCATLTGTIYFIQHGPLEIRWGRGYLNYIPRTVPAFLWQDRPDDEAWMFSRALGETSGGGFFELAEAYYNFGWFGIVVVPFLLSSIFSRLFFNCIVRGTLFNFFCLWGIAGVWWRGAWYQTFAYWRGLTTALVMYLVLAAVLALAHRWRLAKHF